MIEKLMNTTVRASAFGNGGKYLKKIDEMWGPTVYIPKRLCGGGGGMNWNEKHKEF
jgi:hypothetical protein